MSEGEKDDRARRPAGWDVPPWELPGNFRLDCQPHRGPLLRRLANSGLVCAVVSWFPCGCCLAPCVGWGPGQVGLSLLVALPPVSWPWR
jgi:hypothetical protein